MVTQQIFGRSIPDEKLAISCIEDMMLRIRNHPSLVHFLGHDETFPTETLDAAYRDMIAKYAPDRTYQPHSGAFDIAERFQTGGTRTGSLQVWTYAPPNHYYISKDTGAWGFAQSGGIGGIFASYDTMRRMLPADSLWPPFTPAWSLHTVTQGGKYFQPLMEAVNARYGESANLPEFLKRAWMLNYECARGMFESYGRNKYSATGLTTWKYDAAWPASPTWQYIDWYLSPTGGYYGAKKACEPLHIQYSYDDGSVWVINTFSEAFSGLKASAKLLDMSLAEKWSKTADMEVGPDGKAEAFKVEIPNDISKTHFLRLELTDKDGAVRSENFYWLSTVPDIPNEHSRSFAKPASVADYRDLNSLPAVELKKSVEFTEANGEKTARVMLENPTQHLALFVRLALKQGDDGNEISPIYWNDNCVTLLPGAKKELTAKFSVQNAGDKAPVLVVDGWNAK
jgi:exo-1,4-beta-D-glucosaminidase